MKKILYSLFVMSLPLFAVSCNSALEKGEVEKDFNPGPVLPEATLSEKVSVFEYEKRATVTINLSELPADELEDFEVGVVCDTLMSFGTSFSAAVFTGEVEAGKDLSLDVTVYPGKTNYIKAFTSASGYADYSEILAVDVPDIPWYFKIPEHYVGTVVPNGDEDDEEKHYKDHKITVEFPNGIELGVNPRIKLGNIDPYLVAQGSTYDKGANFVEGTLDINTGEVLLDSDQGIIDIHAGNYVFLGVEQAEDDKFSIVADYKLKFNTSANRLTVPMYAIGEVGSSGISLAFVANDTEYKAN